jgi:protein SCO1/2
MSESPIPRAHASPPPWRALIAAAGIALGSAMAPVAAAHSLDELEQKLFDREQYFQIKNVAAPDFALEDADGETVALSDLRGKVVILHFIYASCPDVCPLHAEKLAEVQEMMAITPMKEQVAFVTITTDPARDTPDVLREYGALHGLDPANWMILTSGPGEPEDATRRLAGEYGLKFTQTDDGLQMHGIVAIVLDREGLWRASFHGLQFQPVNLVLYVNALVNDVHRPGGDGRPAPSFWERLFSWF